MRILITNDDGINAPGLTILENIADTLAGPQGEVWVVAPAFDQSGVAHCVNLARPILVSKLAKQRFSVEGTPADCVLVGLHEVLSETRPDVVLSGVNRGNNSAENTLYSGTLGAAMEAALQGHLSIALSQYYGPANKDLDNPFEAAAHHGVDLLRTIIDHDLGNSEYRVFYNVNFPPVAAAAVKGIKMTSQGRRPDVQYGVVGHISPSGKRFVWLKGGGQHIPTAEGTDAKANLEGYISVTPMCGDLTDYGRVNQFRTTL